MKSYIDKILYTIYIQDVLGFLKTRFKLSRKYTLVELFLEELKVPNIDRDAILNLADSYFQYDKFYFHEMCLNLIRQILFLPSINTVRFNTEYLKNRDFPFLILIANSLGRFDLGLALRIDYCSSLERSALEWNSNCQDKILYFFYKQLFGNEFFHRHNEEIIFNVPFYLKDFHNRLIFKCPLNDLKMNKVDLDYMLRINKKSIAILAPGILSFDEELVNDLREFDEIIPITYTYNHYKDFPLPINISYYNSTNSIKLFDDKIFFEGNELEIYCLKKNKKNPILRDINYRTIIRDTNKWILGSPNMVQMSLYDLLCQSPNKVKIFGMNFYLSDNFHHKNYRSSVLNTSSLLQEFADHDLASNFLYIQNHFIKGDIELDKEAKDIINKGLFDYTFEMTKKYCRLL